MPEFLESSLPYLPAALLPLLLLLLAPIRESTGRGRIAALFALAAVAMVVIAIRQASATATLDVLNPFPTSEDLTPTVFVTERVAAPGWHWPLCAAVVLAALALGTFAAVRRPARPPAPVVYCLFAGTLYLAVRLAFEKTAAPQGLVWATGVTPSQLLILFFLGVYAAGLSWSFGRFVLALCVLAVLQRAVVVQAGFFATINKWGTHLDVNAVTHLNAPFGGMRSFGAGQAVDKWLWAILVPQMTLWVLITLVLGLILGGIAFRLCRR